MEKDTVIGYPCYDGRPEMYSVMPILDSLRNAESPIAGMTYVAGCPPVGRVRNIIAHKFLQSNYSYLLFIDSDIIVKSEDIQRIRQLNKKVCGGVYLLRELPYSPVFGEILGKEGELLKVKEVGTGFMMVHREVFETISKNEPEHYYVNRDGVKFQNTNHQIENTKNETHYDYFRNGVINNTYYSEDYYFCYLARKYGYDIYLDPTIVLKHVGKTTYPYENEALLRGASKHLKSLPANTEIDQTLLLELQESIDYQNHIRAI